MYKYVLLDADSTLLDFDTAEKTAFLSVLKEFGYDGTDSDIAEYHEINQSLWDILAVGGIELVTLRTRRFEIFFERKGLDFSAEAFNASYVEALSHQCQIFDGAEELCKRLSENHILAIVTNGLGVSQHRRIAATPLMQYMSHIFISGVMGVKKPEKEYFDVVFRDMKITDLNDVIIVGDSLLSDISGGKNAGIATLWYNPTGKPNNTSIIPDYEARSFDEVFEIANR